LTVKSEPSHVKAAVPLPNAPRGRQHKHKPIKCMIKIRGKECGQSGSVSKFLVNGKPYFRIVHSDLLVRPRSHYLPKKLYDKVDLLDAEEFLKDAGVDDEDDHRGPTLETRVLSCFDLRRSWAHSDLVREYRKHVPEDLDFNFESVQWRDSDSNSIKWAPYSDVKLQVRSLLEERNGLVQAKRFEYEVEEGSDDAGAVILRIERPARYVPWPPVSPTAIHNCLRRLQTKKKVRQVGVPGGKWYLASWLELLDEAKDGQDVETFAYDPGDDSSSRSYFPYTRQRIRSRKRAGRRYSPMRVGFDFHRAENDDHLLRIHTIDADSDFVSNEPFWEGLLFNWIRQLVGRFANDYGDADVNPSKVNSNWDAERDQPFLLPDHLAGLQKLTTIPEKGSEALSSWIRGRNNHHKIRIVLELDRDRLSKIVCRPDGRDFLAEVIAKAPKEWKHEYAEKAVRRRRREQSGDVLLHSSTTAPTSGKLKD
jgi:hypothetical protein